MKDEPDLGQTVLEAQAQPRAGCIHLEKDWNTGRNGTRSYGTIILKDN